MDDTETEARRLFAAATGDMPPEIDLLGGFAAARRQARSRRTRQGAVLSAGIAAAAATVTAVTLTAGSAPPARTTSSAPPARTAGSASPARTASSAPDALAAVTSALTSTLSQSYHVAQQSTEHDTKNGQTKTYIETCRGEADPERHLLTLSCYEGSEHTVERDVGGYAYSFGGGDHPGGKPWTRANGSGSGLGFLTIDILNTAKQLLAEIKGQGTVTVAGPASGPGWTGTRYAYNNPKYGFGGTVTVDQQGRVRALTGTLRDTSLGLTSVLTQTMTFSDFGAPVTVTPPPADQTYVLPPSFPLPR
jgi:hypothetical protein